MADGLRLLAGEADAGEVDGFASRDSQRAIMRNMSDRGSRVNLGGRSKA